MSNPGDYYWFQDVMQVACMHCCMYVYAAQQYAGDDMSTDFCFLCSM